jgi:hypothetical protein
MKDWNGREIEIAKSKGCVLVAANPFDNLISTGVSPWPPSEIVQKLYQSRQVRAFSGEQRKVATRKLGYYCDIQSVHSEDAITWSVFGTIAHASQQARSAWVKEFLSLLQLTSAADRTSEVFLWRRVPHPDTLVSGGPEVDFGILTKDVVVLGEAKWRSSVAENQGKARDKTQIDLRREFLYKYWDQIAGGGTKCAVLLVGFHTISWPSSRTKIPVPVRSLTWGQVCSLESHPLHDELIRYLAWKERNSKSGDE